MIEIFIHFVRMRLESPNSRADFKQLIKLHTKKKILVKFSAQWCNPCKTIAELVESEFNKITGGKLLIYVDVDKQNDVATYFKIRKLPTLMTIIDGYRDSILESSDETEIVDFMTKFNKV